jgi:hypothetical protein
MSYPGSVPEFRLLIKADGTQVLQLRYVQASMGYRGLWQNVPVVHENEQHTANV